MNTPDENKKSPSNSAPGWILIVLGVAGLLAVAWLMSRNDNTPTPFDDSLALTAEATQTTADDYLDMLPEDWWPVGSRSDETMHRAYYIVPNDENALDNRLYIYDLTTGQTDVGTADVHLGGYYWHGAQRVGNAFFIVTGFDDSGMEVTLFNTDDNTLQLLYEGVLTLDDITYTDDGISIDVPLVVALGEEASLSEYRHERCTYTLGDDAAAFRKKLEALQKAALKEARSQ